MDNFVDNFADLFLEPIKKALSDAAFERALQKEKSRAFESYPQSYPQVIHRLSTGYPQFLSEITYYFDLSIARERSLTKALSSLGFRRI